MTRTVDLTDAQAAHYNPIDGLLYAGRRGSGTDGLYRIDADGTATRIATGSNVAAVVVDHDDGDVFFSEDYDGVIYRTVFGGTGDEAWVSGFHSGDDDPVGMAIAPNGYTGSVLSPGEALVVDRGHSGPDEVWKFSPDSQENEVLLHGDTGSLVDAVDVTIGLASVYIADTGATANGTIYEMGPAGTLSGLSLAQTIADPVGICIDPLTQELYVLDAGADSLLRVVPATGTVTTLISGFGDLVIASWGGIDVHPDGHELYVTDRGDGKIYTFSDTDDIPEPSALILLAIGLAALVSRRQSRLN